MLAPFPGLDPIRLVVVVTNDLQFVNNLFGSGQDHDDGILSRFVANPPLLDVWNWLELHAILIY